MKKTKILLLILVLTNLSIYSQGITKPEKKVIDGDTSVLTPISYIKYYNMVFEADKFHKALSDSLAKVNNNLSVKLNDTNNKYKLVQEKFDICNGFFDTHQKIIIDCNTDLNKQLTKNKNLVKICGISIGINVALISFLLLK